MPNKLLVPVFSCSHLFDQWHPGWFGVREPGMDLSDETCHGSGRLGNDGCSHSLVRRGGSTQAAKAQF